MNIYFFLGERIFYALAKFRLQSVKFEKDEASIALCPTPQRLYESEKHKELRKPTQNRPETIIP